MNPDLFWIPGPWPGRLAVITRPRGGDWLEDEIGGWKRAGLDLVVSLLEDDEASQLELSDEDAAARLGGIRFISFPIPDRSVPASLPDAVGLLREIAKALREGRNVAVHCRQGRWALRYDRLWCISAVWGRASQSHRGCQRCAGTKRTRDSDATALGSEFAD